MARAMQHFIRFTSALFHFSARRPWTTLSLVFVVTALAWLQAAQLRVESNFVDLLPQDQPSVQALRELEDIVGGASYVVATFEPQAEMDTPAFLEALAARLESHPGVRFLDYRPPTDFFRPNALLYLSESSLSDLKTRVEQRIAQLKLGGMYLDLQDEDTAFDAQALESKFPLAGEHQYYQSGDGKLFVMLIKPVGRSTDIAFTRNFVADIQDIIAETRSTFGSSAAETQLQITLTGPYVKSIAQVESVSRDATVVVSIAALLMLAIVTGYFRSKRAVIMVGLPLACSVVWTLGITSLAFGALNFFTSICCAVILGLSADFGIHLFNHYAARRRQGEAVIDALDHAYTQLSPSMTVALFTTACAFFALMVSDFSPLYEFGAIAGSGLICAFFSLLLLFPSLAVLMERRWPVRVNTEFVARSSQRWTQVYLRLREPRVLLGGLAIITLLLGVVAWQPPQFDYNFANLMGRQPTRALDDRVDRIFYYSVNPELAGAQSRADAAAFARAIRDNQAQYEHSTVHTALSIDDFIPAQQESKRQLIAELKAVLDDAADLLGALNPEERAQYDRLYAAVTPTQVTAQDLPESITTKFRGLDGSLGSFVYIFPSYDRQQGRELDQFVREIRAVQCPSCEEPVVVSGESIIFHEIMTRLLAESRIVIALSCLAVFFALWTVFRSLRDALLCAAPLGVAIIALLGSMSLLGIKFTLVNIAAVPILLGTGIDYAIYYYQQWRSESMETRDLVYIHAAPAIWGSVLTTGAGFAALMLADNGGAASLGKLMALGIVLSAVATLVWFPAMLYWRRKHHSRRAQGPVEQQTPQCAKCS